MRNVLFLFFVACTSTSTGSSCPTTNAPTYASFGQRFFGRYCTGCHSRMAHDRHGAPIDVQLDSEADVRQHATAIDAEAAAGPDAVNRDMPDLGGPVHVAPSDAERTELGQFLACEQQKP